MSESCLLCERIVLIESGNNPDFVAELSTGYVVIGWHQLFYGYSLFIAKGHKSELHELQEEEKVQFLKEMSEVAEAVQKAFNAKKMNYELLGNSEPHMHWHLFPRRDSDPVRGPVWLIPQSELHAESTRVSSEELASMKERLLHSLKQTTQVIRSYKE